MDRLGTPADKCVNRFINQLFSDISTKRSNLSSLDALPLGLNLSQIRNEKSQTLLHIAAGFGRKRIVENLISEGADVNAQDAEGQAPLHYACNHAHNLIAELLIEAGANTNLVDSKGWSPLDFAIARKDNAHSISPKYWHVVELLLRRGADPYKKAISGKSCLDRVKDTKQRLCIRLLRLDNRLSDRENSEDRIETINRHLRDKDFFAMLIAEEPDECFELIEKILTPKFIKARLQSLNNITPLHRAAGRGHLKVAQLLIKNGADVNATDDHGQVPLHNASRYGHVEMIELLIKEGCDVNVQDNDGMSALHVVHNFVACLRLIEAGADISLMNNDGKRPYDFAEGADVKKVLKKAQERVSTATCNSHYEQAIYMQLSDNDGPAMPSDIANESRFDELMLDSRSQERLFENTQHTIKKVILKESDHRYQLVKQRMLSTIRYHSNDTGGNFTTYEVLTIERILHEQVWQKYKKRCEILDLENVPRAERLLFHGSTSIDNIQRYGFDHRYAQRDGMFGAGIYFAAHSSKSNQYVFGLAQGCIKHKDKSCYACDRKLIYAQVALGESFVSPEAMPELPHPPPGYWSVSGEPGITQGLQYPEYVIYDGHQAYPLYVITYRLKR